MKSQVKPSQSKEILDTGFSEDNDVVIAPSDLVMTEYKYSEIEAVINKYYESKGNKTPILVERSDLLNFIQENI